MHGCCSKPHEPLRGDDPPAFRNVIDFPVRDGHTVSLGLQCIVGHDGGLSLVKSPDIRVVCSALAPVLF
jgi:hypothetical protein